MMSLWPSQILVSNFSHDVSQLITVLEDATKPEEWDDQEDGDWIAPTVPNPKCADAAGCGEWKRFVKIKNPLSYYLID